MRLRLGSRPLNEVCAFATTVPSEGFDEQIDTARATASPHDPESSCSASPEGATAWYRFQSPVSGTVRASTTGSSYDTVVSMWLASEGCEVLETEVTCNDDSAPGLQSELSFVATEGTSYLIRVGRGAA